MPHVGEATEDQQRGESREGRKAARYDVFGTLITRQNKKRVKVAFRDDLPQIEPEMQNSLTDVFLVASFKSYNKRDTLKSA